MIRKHQKRRKVHPHLAERLELLKQIAKRQPSASAEKDDKDFFFSFVYKIVKKMSSLEPAE